MNHYPETTVKDLDKDWCSTCDAVTVYNGETCTCCGRVWGYENGKCQEK